MLINGLCTKLIKGDPKLEHNLRRKDVIDDVNSEFASIFSDSTSKLSKKARAKQKIIGIIDAQVKLRMNVYIFLVNAPRLTLDVADSFQLLPEHQSPYFL
jgi:hypothetical protein